MARAVLACAVVALVAIPLNAQYGRPSADRPNYKLAEKFSSTRLRKFLYSTSVRPNWIGKTDRFHYAYKTSKGARYWLVDAKARTKKLLFDHDKLAAAISAATRKPVDANTLTLGSLSVDDKLTTLKFSAGGRQYEYVLATGVLTDKGRARRSSNPFSSRGRGRGRGRTRGINREEMQRRFEEFRRLSRNRNRDRQELLMEFMRGGGGVQTTQRGRGRSTRRDHRAFSPDKSCYVYVENHNLYYVEGVPAPPAKADAKSAEKKADKKAETKTTEKKDGGNGNGNGNGAAAAKDTKKTPAPRWVYDEKKAVQLTKDGAEKYSYGGSSRVRFAGRTRGTTRTTTTAASSTTRSRKSRPSVSWSKNSKAFYLTRRDTRGVKELFLVNSIGQPRPTLQTYSYPMPGEEGVRKSELYVFNRESKKLERIAPKWKDESYSSLHWRGDGHTLRFMRRDRLQRNIEVCSVDPVAGTGSILFREGFESANLSTQSMRYLDKRKEFIWWSERSGWGHFYLYDAESCELKNAITSGQFRASRIVAVDEDRGQMWFRGNAREKGENIYYEHLYRVDLDGTGLVCLDPGDATHRSTLSPSRRFVVDNCSRVDMAPRSILRDANGKEIMKLEEADLSKLAEMGWQMPETFTVKAADGVTDLYGNMWKPFDFNPKKKYPIIVYVYPGPQQEGVTHTFSASGSRQQLAQIGFIVIQVGHRGGTPTRSKAYGSYGYFNLRDYGLEDKKAAIEQLADQHPYIDIDRVGIYGHSGGGFMTAAALMKPPYNDFFKVGVASAGNHDNNIYNSNWSERYHGLKEVQVEEKKTETSTERGRRGRRGRRGGVGIGEEAEAQDKKDQDKKKTVSQGEKQDEKKTQDGKKTDGKKTDGKKTDDEKKKSEKKTKFEIKVPTNAELAAGLKGHLLLVHGEIDNNVHPANTMRLVDALIKANKRFDMLIIPGARHGFGRAQTYFTHKMWEFFAEHLLGHSEQGADILDKRR